MLLNHQAKTKGVKSDNSHLALLGTGQISMLLLTVEYDVYIRIEVLLLLGLPTRSLCRQAGQIWLALRGYDYGAKTSLFFGKT